VRSSPTHPNPHIAKKTNRGMGWLWTKTSVREKEGTSQTLAAVGRELAARRIQAAWAAPEAEAAAAAATAAHLVLTPVRAP
jgi:hypothetical protein